MAEVRNFKMHPKLLYDVIKRQAGSLSKAILEGVMNGIDARAGRIDVTLTPSLLTIVDDGKGFTDRSEIERFFETFGQPHEEAERKIYGQFRMGRGQLFSFGVNTWRTATFKMAVDIMGRGLDYLLEDQLPMTKGCTIEVQLYEEQSPSELDSTLRDVVRAVKYVTVPVYLNGKQINTDPATVEWTHDTPEAFIKLKPTGSLVVYNLGVFVQEIANHHFGTGGVVVAKQQLRVNFARNDVQNDCKVWRKIKPLLSQLAQQSNTRAPTLTDGARKRLADQLRLGQLTWEEARNLRIFTDVTGRHHSLKQLLRMGRQKVTSASEGNPQGDKFMQQGLGFVFSDETLDRFEVDTVKQLLKLLTKFIQEHRSWDSGFTDWVPVPFSQVEEAVESTYQLLSDKELTPLERAKLATIQTAVRTTLIRDLHVPERTIRLGTAGSALAWTDGASYVAIERDYLTSLTPEAGGWARLGLTLIHEYMHEDPSTNTHVHSPEFYRNFHDSADFVGRFVEQALREYPRYLSQHNRRLTKAALRAADHRHKATQGERSLVLTAASAAK